MVFFLLQCFPHSSQAKNETQQLRARTVGRCFVYVDGRCLRMITLYNNSRQTPQMVLVGCQQRRFLKAPQDAKSLLPRFYFVCHFLVLTHTHARSLPPKSPFPVTKAAQLLGELLRRFLSDPFTRSGPARL